MSSTCPVFLCLPAMGVGGRFYRRFASTLEARTGGTALAVDLLSSGSARKVVGEFGYREIVEEEIPSLVAQARRKYPKRPIVLCGHSLGGQLALLASGLMSRPPDALVLITAGTAYHRAWPLADRRRARMAVQLISLAARMLPWYPGNWLGFGGDQPCRLMRDWTFNATTGRYRFEGGARDESAILVCTATMRIPILSVGIMGDLVAPEGAQEELLAYAPRADITRLHIDVDGLDSRWKRHFSWARDPLAIVESIAQWATSAIANQSRDIGVLKSREAQPDKVPTWC